MVGDSNVIYQENHKYEYHKSIKRNYLKLINAFVKPLMSLSRHTNLNIISLVVLVNRNLTILPFSIYTAQIKCDANKFLPIACYLPLRHLTQQRETVADSRTDYFSQENIYKAATIDLKLFKDNSGT